jgi:hypothetical protein
MTPRARIAIVVVALVALVVAFIAASGSDDENSPTSDTIPATQTVGSTVETTPSGTTTTTTTTSKVPAPATPVITVVDAKPQGGVKRLTFNKGDTIRFTVKSDVSDEIHVHGYDVHKDVKAGGSVTFSIPAKIDGRFVVELESRGTQIAELEVEP